MYQIYLNDELQCETEWPPHAQAAWNRAVRNRNSAQHGGDAVLIKDGCMLAQVRPRMKDGHAWPDKDVPECTWHDVVRQLVLLLRDDGMSTRDIADAMTASGLPTTRARIDALRGSTKGKRTEVIPAELVTMIAAAVAAGVDEN